VTITSNGVAPVWEQAACHSIWDRYELTVWVLEAPSGWRVQLRDKDGDPKWMTSDHRTRAAAVEAARDETKRSRRPLPPGRRNVPKAPEPPEESVQTLLRVLIDAVKENTRTLKGQHEDMMRVWGDP
jgi:hypothetical protein